MKARLALAAVMLAAFYGGCSLMGNDESSTLAENRLLWQRAGSDDYDFEYFKGCYCLWAGRARIFVRDDTVHAVLDPASGDTLRHPQSGESMLELHPELFPTIDQLFDIVELAIEKEADEVKVDYQKEMGYPERVEIDYRRRAIDDEVSHAIRHLMNMRTE